MKKINLKMIKIPIILLIVLMVSLITIPFSFKPDKVKAETNIDLSQFIDSDELVTRSNYNIRDYVGNLHATEGVVYNETIYSQNLYFKNISKDDPITDIIPKEYFYSIGTQLKIGEEYGFFILTQDQGMYFYSVAMVFDINYEFEESTGKIITSVKPIFSYDYVCLKPSYSSVTLFTRPIEYNIDDYWVIPLPTNIDRNEYNFSPRFSLQDVSIAGSLYNEQELNKGDENYDPYNDLGLFFTDIEYLCQVKENPPDFNVLSTGLGVVSLLVGIASTPASAVFSIAALLIDDIKYEQEYAQYLVNPICEIGKCSYDSFLNNRDDQLAANIDENGEHYLIKQVGVAFNTVSDIKYGVNEAAIAKFKTSHAALNPQVPNHTRFLRNIALKIYDNYNREVITTDYCLSNHMIKNPVSKTLTMDKEETVSLLEQGTNHYNFYADYTSDYNIHIDSETPVRMIINNEEVVGTNNNFMIKLLSGQTANIKLFGNQASILSKIVISPSSNCSNIKIDKNDYYLIKANLSKVTNIKSDNQDVKISRLCTIDGQKLEDYNTFGNIIPYCEISYPFFNDIYYIVLKNDNDTMHSVNLSFSNPKILELENSTTSDLTLNYTYFEFQPTSDGQHILTVTNLDDNNLKYKLLDKNLNNINYDKFVYNECELPLDSEKAYYIGVACNPVEQNNQIEKDASLAIRVSDKAYCWEIIGGNYGAGQKTYEGEFKPERGEIYQLKFWINDAVLRTAMFSIDEGGYDFSVTTEGILIIKEDTPIGGSGIRIKAICPENNNASYNHELKIIPQSKTDTTIEGVNNSKLGFNFKLPKDTDSFEYKLTYNSVSKTFIRNVPDTYDPKTSLFEDILSKYFNMNCSGAGYITIDITKLSINTIDKEKIVYQGNFASTQVHNLFAGGTGNDNDPYLISDIRHLKNIPELTTRTYYINEFVDKIGGYYKLISDISTYSFTPINNFWGVFDGNGKTITITTMRIPVTAFTSMQYFGLFGLVRYANIKNLNLSIDISGSQQNYGSTVFVGGIAGYNEHGVIENCRVSKRIYVPRKNSYVGGIVGYNSSKGKIISCSNSAYIYTTGTKGNICGVNYGQIL